MRTSIVWVINLPRERIDLSRMIWPDLLHLVGYSVGVLGIVLLIWSLLKQGVSMIGLMLLIAGFLVLVISGFMEQA